MASIKSLLPAALLLVVVAFAPHGAQAAGPVPVALLTGVVPCSTGSSINMAAVPVFPNARVQMVCGGRVMAGATADGNGAFMINMPVTSMMITSMVRKECKAVVTTPLAACNVSLAGATGTLTAPLQLVGDDGGSGGLGGLIGLIAQIISGLLGGILKIVPLPFSLV